MKIIKEINSFYKLYQSSWDGAKDTLITIRGHNKENELMAYLDTVYPDTVDAARLNDFLWFERDHIYECLGIKED